MSVIPSLESIAFPNPYQYLTVNAQDLKVIWYMPVSGGFTAFVDRVYIKWFTNTSLEFYVDGFSVEGKIEYTIGSLADPRKYEPPLVAHKEVKVIANNTDTSSHIFEALINGVLVRPKP